MFGKRRAREPRSVMAPDMASRPESETLKSVYVGASFKLEAVHLHKAIGLTRSKMAACSEM